MKITFWNDSTMSEFWGYVRMLLEGIQPGVMLVAAVAAAGLLLGIIVKAFRKSDQDEDDQDVEVRHY
ncbi:hypothetical protein [Virgibacillus sp. SK37]|uniref:hypothetical protein n=1 Tax=Virgibacillus sp. SK37 TaxID=403957 RepID=UPI0004D1E755|nr:hypothetical protein [Virgibacillus sp. SK37]AIF45723.1 hypothetical protein X953_19805 [Virgibacillus sp. SK37]